MLGVMLMGLYDQHRLQALVSQPQLWPCECRMCVELISSSGVVRGRLSPIVTMMGFLADGIPHSCVPVCSCREGGVYTHSEHATLSRRGADVARVGIRPVRA